MPDLKALCATTFFIEIRPAMLVGPAIRGMSAGLRNYAPCERFSA
jgi:hypothetical protein